MKLKKTMFSAILAFACVSASAQEVKVENVFLPHWYVQVQAGGQHTLGEVEFQDLLSPNVQVAAGYQFDKVLGARFSVNAWQSKAGSDFNVIENTNDINKVTQFNPRWKWNYVAPSVDLTVNLSNLVCGYNPNRFFNLGAFIGIGANFAFNNDEATQVYNDIKSVVSQYTISNEDQFLRYYWEGSKVRLTARAGVTADFRLSDRMSLGLEVNANTLSDRYNSKKAGDRSADWYFNGLVGLKVNLGKTHVTREHKCCGEPQIVYQDRIVEKVVEKPVETIVTAEPLKETIFYAIRISDPNADEILDKVVAWCNKYPTKKITVDGYADKGTGTPAGNVKYAKDRAQKVADKLQAKGVDASRMIVNSYGDTVQPFNMNEMNRCVIIVGQ